MARGVSRTMFGSNRSNQSQFPNIFYLICSKDDKGWLRKREIGNKIRAVVRNWADNKYDREGER